MSELHRRDFLGLAASCAGYLLLTGERPLAALAARGRAGGRIVAEEPWARIEAVVDGVWAVISTPQQDRRTLCNGAIVGGRDGVLVLEAFGSVEGGRWVANWARKLGGRAADGVVLSHFHFDHTTGLAGYAGEGATESRVHATDTTVRLVGESDVARKAVPDPVKARMLAGHRPIDPTRFSRIDLGGRIVRITPLAGHTPSDVLLEIEDANIVLGGDLLWNRYFPNYMSAIPSTLSTSVRRLVRDRETRYVPGHGPMADHQDVERYIELIELVDHAAREAFRQGVPAAEAARRFTIPPTLGEWMASPRSVEVAFTAWESELRGATPS